MNTGMKRRSHYERFCIMDRPMFVHLEFASHVDAWRAFVRLEAACSAAQESPLGVPIKVSWVRGSAYWAAATKERDRKLKTDISLGTDESSHPPIYHVRPNEGAMASMPEAI